MKVLLVITIPDPQTISFSSMDVLEPLSLEYVGAGIQQDFDVKIVDLRLENEKTFTDIFESFKPDILACGAYTTDVIPVKNVFIEAKKRNPGVLTVIGGIHVTLNPADFMEPFVDIIVIGEGTAPFKKICENHKNKKSFDEIQGIYFRKNKNDEKMIFTGAQPEIILDDLPLPARNLTAPYRANYMSKQIFGPEPLASMRGSYGCVYNCKFCSVRTLTNRKLYKRSIDKIIEELASLKENNVIWVDDEFFLDPSRAVLLANEIEKAGIKKKHLLYARADHMVNRPDCVEAWSRVGLLYVMVGLEFISDKYLKEVDKGYHVPINKEAIKIMHANNVKVRGGFIVHPDFKKDDFKQLIDYVLSLKIDLPNFFILTPLPGTKYYEEVYDNLVTRNYNLFDCFHPVLPTNLPLKKFYKEYGNLFTSSVSFKAKMKMLRELSPEIRWKVVKNGIKMIKKINGAYKHLSPN